MTIDEQIKVLQAYKEGKEMKSKPQQSEKKKKRLLKIYRDDYGH